jgi:enamine deaminase RidA (YjgF/YER057c/UK114 family)
MAACGLKSGQDLCEAIPGRVRPKRGLSVRLYRVKNIMKIEQRIKEMKMTLVDLVKPQGAYIPAVKHGHLIVTSGQLPFQDQRLLFSGRVGKEVSVENAQRAAKVAALNCLAAIRYLCHDLDKVKKIVRVNGFVCSALGFTEQPRVLNGASEFLVELFGEAIGTHTRCAIGAFELPLGACVEIDMTVEIT